MTDLQPLLAAIITNPDDDVPRLMYADELMGSDDVLDRSLGEYIKLSVELANHKKPGLPQTTSLGEAYKKGIELADKVHNLWGNCHLHPNIVSYVGQTANKYNSAEMRLEFEIDRGFIHSITCTATQFLSISDKLIWHESMEDKCPQECVDGWHENSGSSGDWKCKACNNGKIARRCPLTAHPVREVEITDCRSYVEKMLPWQSNLCKYGIKLTIFGISNPQ